PFPFQSGRTFYHTLSRRRKAEGRRQKAVGGRRKAEGGRQTSFLPTSFCLSGGSEFLCEGGHEMPDLIEIVAYGVNIGFQRRQWFGERLCQERGEAAFNRLGLCAQVVQLLGKQVVILFQFSDVSGTCGLTLQGVLHVFKPGDGVVKPGP